MKETVRVSTRISLNKSHVPVADYRAFYSEVQNALRTCSGRIFFNKRKIDEKTQALESQLENQPDNVSSQLALSKRYLKTGRYEEAHQLLEQAVAVNQTNGELYYFYGIALGYIGRYEDAGKALATAKRLGYIP